MNSAINKTFYTCSTESFLLRNKKIFKKAVKLVSFVQCLGHIFLGHDGGFWKIKLRILWNHIMKNFQIKHGQCDSIIFPETSSFESFKQLLDFSFAGSRIRYFWQVLESIHKFIIELHVLQCSFVRRGRVISNFTKGENFDLLYNQVLLGVISQYDPLLAPSRKYLFLPFTLVKMRTYVETQMKGKNCFENCLGVPYSHS